MVRESLYYPYLERFLRRSLGCFTTEQTTGPPAVGPADVLGVRDLGGTLSGDVELIAVEVKLNTSNFGKHLGQALGYSLFSHKCYLAVPMKKRERFTPEQRELAIRLGVGLIEIRGWRARQCVEVLNSPYHEPIDALMLRALYLVDYFKCAVCGTMVHALDREMTRRPDVAASESKMLYIQRQVLDGRRVRPLMFTRTRKEAMRKETYICPDCVERLAVSTV